MENVEIKIIDGSEQTLALCMDTGEKPLRIVRYDNRSSGRTAVIRVEPVNWEFGIPPGGNYHCVMRGDQFVQTVGTLTNYGKRGAFVTDGRMCYEFDEEESAYWEAREEPICRGIYGLDHRGNVISAGRHFPYGENGYPVVFVRDGIGVDAEGLLCPEPDTLCAAPGDCRVILGVGLLCIGSKRQVLYRGQPTLEEEKALDAWMCRYGYLVLTYRGETWFSTNGRGWQPLEDNAVAISARENTLAIADADGNVFLYQHNGHTLQSRGRLCFPGKHVSELAVSDETVIVKFSDCTFDIVDWKTKQTCLNNEVFFRPKTDYLKNIPEGADEEK